MKYKIGVYGSAVNEKESICKTAQKLGRILGDYNVIVVTGACSGIPYLVASEAAKKRKEIWGFSPELNLEKQKKAFPDDNSAIYSKLFYVPGDFPFSSRQEVCRRYRNVTSTATVDAGIIIAGRWGTLNEYTNLYDMGKVIGILDGTGGVADELKNLSQKIYKPSNAKIFFNNDPNELVELVLAELKKRTY